MKIRGNTVGTTIKPEKAIVKATKLTDEQKTQVKANIGVTDYYSTEREEIGIEHDDINSEYIWGLYDALMAEYPDKVQKNPIYNNDGTFTNYEYVVSTGEYNTEGYYGEAYESDNHIKKPKYLVLSGIHGSERKTAISTYRFIRDVISGRNVPQDFKEGAIISVIPIGNPSGFDAFTYENDNGVNINRNFNVDDPAKETQSIKNWLNKNADAVLFLDFHNSCVVNEVVAVLGDSNNDATDMAKKIALQGVDRVIPFWRDVIGYHKVESVRPNGEKEEMDAIFSYSASANIEGSAIYYAQNDLDIPSIAIETSAYYGDYSEWENNKTEYPAETIAAGAEALGNILIEFYKQSFFGEVIDDMKEIDNKLERLEENIASMSRGFRTESGVMVVDADVLPADGAASITVKIPCSNGAKMFTFCADSETMTAISNEYKQTSPKSYVGSVLGNCFEQGVTYYGGTRRSYMSMMAYYEAMSSYHKGWVVGDWATTANNTDGATFVCKALKAGTYHWTAYYWND